MERQHYSQKTVENYGSCATSYLAYFKSLEHPLHITDEQFANYLYEKFKDQSTQRANHSAVKKFYKICFGKDRFRYLPYAKKKETQIIILSEEEMLRLLQVMTNLKHFCITLLFYSTGIRINELLNIKFATDIDEANGVIYIMGKGAKPRPVTMKPKLLEVIKAYLLKYKPQYWLFENDKTHKRYTEGSINLFLKANALKAGITKEIHAHLIRHCFASHSIPFAGLYMIQELLGHSDPKITAGTYIHNNPRMVSQAYSPIDSLPIDTQKQNVLQTKNELFENKQHQIQPNDTSKCKIYQILFNGKTYLLKERDNKIIDAPQGAKWSIGVVSEKAIKWFKKNGAEVTLL